MILNFKLSGVFIVTSCVISFLIMLDLYLYWTMQNNCKASKKQIDLDENYLINLPNCKIPALDPLGSCISHFIVPNEKPISLCARPLTKVNYYESTGEHRLELMWDTVPHYYTDLDVKCCIRIVEEVPIFSIQKECILFNGSIKIAYGQIIAVFCIDKEANVIYKNLHTAVVRTNNNRRERNHNSNKLNVLMIGIDSLSRLNLYRMMPLTVKYLKTTDWVEMRGYNKIADNTLPNLMAVLTGMAPGQYSNSHSANYDHLPFIWNKYLSDGYVTAYAEDKPFIGTFTCRTNKFSGFPTDHYPWRFFLIGEQNFLDNINGTECVGSKSPSEHLFHYLLDYVTVYKNYNFFGFFWTNHISHNTFNLPTSYDTRVLQLLKDLESLGIFKTTMVVFMSDHGLRIGETRKTRVGWFEDRMPFLFFSLPDWYKTKYPLRYFNLIENTNKLTSPYDLYLTLNQVVGGGRHSMAIGCLTCYSLFDRIPSDQRDCANAGISPHWCTCQDIVNVSTDANIMRIAELAVATLNKKIKEDKVVESHYQCAHLKLTQVLYSRKKSSPADNEYVLGIQTEPGLAEFEVTIIRKRQRYMVDDSISRINDYGATSHCAKNPRLREMCYCIPIY